MMTFAVQPGLRISSIDLVTIVLYMVAIVGIGVFVSRRQGRSSAGYFLAGRSLRWPTIGLALFATNISTVHMVGLAAEGYRSGLVYGNFEWMAAFCLVLLGLVFAPFYFKSRVATLPEYLERRFSTGSRTFLAIMAIVGALFIHIGMSLYAGAAIFEQFFGVNVLTSIAIISVATAVYTVIGGLKAVVITEAIQTVLLVLGAAAVTIFSVIALSNDGIDSYAKLRDAIDRQEAADRVAMVHAIERMQAVLRSGAEDSSRDDYAQRLCDAAAGLKNAAALDRVTAVLADSMTNDEAALLVTASTTATAQFASESAAAPSPLVHGLRNGFDYERAADALQRLAAEITTEAQAFASAAESEQTLSNRTSMVHASGELPWYAVLLGYPVLGIWYWCADQTIVQRVLGAREQRDAQTGPLFAGLIKILPVFIMVWPGMIAYVLFRDQIGANYNSTLPVLINELIPIGLKGLIAAGLLAALMSTIAGALNSTATMVSIDIVQRLRPATADKSLVLIGRFTACLVMVLAMLWSTQGGRFESIFAGLNAMIACLAPPITAVFLFGVFWPRGTAQASLATLTLGFVLGVTTFALDFPLVGDERFVTNVLGIPFMMQAWWLFVICSVIFVAVTLATPKPAPEKVRGLCWTNPLQVLGRTQGVRLAEPSVLAAMLVAVMVMLYWTFS